jgi:hypothetical protein
MARAAGLFLEEPGARIHGPNLPAARCTHMPDEQDAEIRSTISAFQTMIAEHTATRERLVKGRAVAIAEEMRRLDRCIAVNGKTLETLKKAVDSMRDHLAQLNGGDKK